MIIVVHFTGKAEFYMHITCQKGDFVELLREMKFFFKNGNDKAVLLAMHSFLQ